MGEGSKREQWQLLCSLHQLSVNSSTTHKQIGHFWCWFPGGWFCVCFRFLWVSPMNPLLWGWEFLPLLQPSKVFTVKGFEALFPALEPWVAWSVSLPSCSSWFICTQMQDHPVLQLLPCCESSPTCCLSLPLLQVWMDVSSLTTWLSDFHTVWFSGSSCCFLFLNLLSFFWLCKEAKCVYLHLHVGQKSTLLYSFDFSHITLKFSLFKHILSSCFKVLAC